MTEPFELRYGRLDRMVHRLAFATTQAQLGLADLEDRMFGRDALKSDLKRPVFVTGLPRAGTTLLLELIASQPEFGTHSYRDMPFVICPLLWDKLSRSFRRDTGTTERAHGDGMTVSVDSPEAFEEMLWKAYWQDHYLQDRIIPWGGDTDPDFDELFTNHMKKIVALRAAPGGAGRYVSKNNANIARIRYLRALFPDALLVIPFREPVAHASSMHRQHLRFTGMHQADPFVRRYMEAIGHHDFGEGFKPIDFGQWLDGSDNSDPERLEFWLAYWSAAYSRLVDETDEGCVLVDFDALCAAPLPHLERLGTAIRFEADQNFTAQVSRISPSGNKDPGKLGAPSSLVGTAQELHQKLRKSTC
ncbi:MAG: sulfotransferase [Geminicoccaceae bacterium]